MPIEQAFESENEEAIYPWSIKRSMEYLEKMKREHLKEKKHAASHSLSPIDLSVSCPNHTSLLSNAVPTRLKDEKELWMNRKIRRLHRNVFKSSPSSLSSDFDNDVSHVSMKLQCVICLELSGRRGIAKLSCSHYFCKNCWKEYCRNILTDEEEITCPLCRRSIERHVDPIPIICGNYFHLLTSVTLNSTRCRSSRDALQTFVHQSQHLLGVEESVSGFYF